MSNIPRPFWRSPECKDEALKARDSNELRERVIIPRGEDEEGEQKEVDNDPA